MCNKNTLLKKFKKLHEDELNIINKMSLFHTGDPYTVEDNFENFDSKVCFVLSCPGREELLSGQVCAGVTGEHLDELLKILNKKCPEYFPSSNRYDYLIMNASNIVHFNALDNKSEADYKEIKQSKNIDRIKKSLNKNKLIKFIVLCGAKAEKIKQLVAGEDYKYIKIPHLSKRGLVTVIHNDINNMPIKKNDDEWLEKRLQVVATNILTNIGIKKE